MICADDIVSAHTARSQSAHWRDLPLHAGGRSLIEASAGTGKTWTISVLYLRLLLEGDAPLGARQIAVTTFTDAAAQELAARLRRRLAWAERLAQAALDGESPAGDGDDAQWLHARWHNGVVLDPARVRADLNRLRLARAEFDLAPIGTLHGMCRRVLTEYPFDCGHAFGASEAVDGRALQAELFEDVWRVLVQSQDTADAGVLAWLARGRRALETALAHALDAGVELRAPDPLALEALVSPDALAAVRELAQPARFKRSNSALLGALGRLADAIENDAFEALDRRTLETLATDPAQHIRPEHLEHCLAHPGYRVAREATVRLPHADAPALAETLAKLRDRVAQQRDRLLRERRQLSFDAQISRVRDALLGNRGSLLAARLCVQWPAMLVDEFQDTDAQQYAILDRIYRDDDGATRGRLVMIGDPKQAIYRFRGGDIHAYLHARADADTRLELRTNFRSCSRLVSALNHWYGVAVANLGGEGAERIAVEPVEPCASADARRLLERGAPVARPLAFHLQPEIGANADDRRKAALLACARQIAGMLASGDYTLDGAPLRPGDIAVLVPKNQDVARLRELLRAHGVPCVGSGRDSVFATPLARELQVFLHGVAHAHYEPAVRAALATRLGGATYESLRAWQGDADGWQAQLARFARWRQRWQAEGVLSVVRDLIAEAAPQLAALDGERVLTDLRHLGELLQAASETLEGANALLAWFAAQREPGEGDAGEEQQLRIESDARRVRLMTLHASKGLEFPVVFLPLMWAQAGRDTVGFPLVHDRARARRVLDLGSEWFDEAVEQAQREDQQERHRTLYVALTRAQHACHVYVLPPDRPAHGRSKAPAVDPQRSALDACVDQVSRALGTLEQLAAHCPHIHVGSGWPWPEVRYRADVVPRPRRARALDEPPAARPRGKHSFSTLIRAVRLNLAEEASAADEAPRTAEPFDAVEPAADEAPHPSIEALSAVRGTEFGNALHAVFELRDTSQPLSAQYALVRRCLLDAGVRTRELPLDELVPRVAERIQCALDAPLLPGLCLSALPANALRAEMEFHFQLDDVSVRALREHCAALGEPDLVPAVSVPRLNGLMTGKIDLVFRHGTRFHVLDYKGNHLGDRLADYAPDGLRAAMDAHHYRFQALVYTVAVDRYLRQRMTGYSRARHLGEAIYLFVRAAGLAPGAGVWTHRFDDALLAGVDAILAGAAA